MVRDQQHRREREREAAGIPKGNSDVNSCTGHQCLDTDLVQREEREPRRDGSRGEITRERETELEVAHKKRAH